MPLALQITLILVLVALAVALVPLLLQLHKTARGLDAFLIAVKNDVTQITDDVHASRLRMDHLASSLQGSLVELASFSKALGEVGDTVRDVNIRFRHGLESASLGLGGVMGWISAVLAFFKSKQSPHEHE
jgi:uncharacterized protein YoxC